MGLKVTVYSEDGKTHIQMFPETMNVGLAKTRATRTAKDLGIFPIKVQAVLDDDDGIGTEYCHQCKQSMLFHENYELWWCPMCEETPGEATEEERNEKAISDALENLKIIKGEE